MDRCVLIDYRNIDPSYRPVVFDGDVCQERGDGGELRKLFEVLAIVALKEPRFGQVPIDYLFPYACMAIKKEGLAVDILPMDASLRMG